MSARTRPLLDAGPTLDAVAAALGADYRIVRRLASGGMGTIYLAEQVRLGRRPVALKVLHPWLADDPEFVERFEEAAAHTARVGHPNVVTVHDCRRLLDGPLFASMELVEGDSLAAHLGRRGRVPLAEAVDVVVQCARGLDAAHRLGIVHRDVKPGHILLAPTPEGGRTVKLLDFGIAKVQAAGGRTLTGTILGTPTYMSYEQASGLSSTKIDGRSDIYALGVVAYEMLAGHPPFQGETPVACVMKHLSEPPPSLRAARPDLPPAVDTVVQRALAKDRDRRFQASLELADALLAAARTPHGGTSAPWGGAARAR